MEKMVTDREAQNGEIKRLGQGTATEKDAEHESRMGERAYDYQGKRRSSVRQR